MLEVSVLELYYWAPYGKRARMTITRIGKKFCIALPIQVGIVSMAAPNSNLTSELRTKWAGPVLNQQDWAKNGWGHLKSGWGEEDSACAHAWQRSSKRRLCAFLPVIDDLPAFVLLISLVRSPPILLLPSSHSPPVPFLSYCPLPPALSKLTFSTLQFSPPPLLTTPSLLCLYLLP